MTTEISDLLAAAAAPTTAVVVGTTDDQLDLPTPCAQFRVRQLLTHLFHVVVNFQLLAARQSVDWVSVPDYLTVGWRDRFADDISGLTAAWSDPGVLQGVSPGMQLPHITLGRMVLLDVVVHGWDLARATDQRYQAHPATVTAGHELVAVMGPRARQAGVFAESVPIPPDGDDLTRLLALTGRDPSWQPPGSGLL